MLNWLLLAILLQIISPAWNSVSVFEIVVRTPREGDVGIIFDINLINAAMEDREVLDYRIRSDKSCIQNSSDTTITKNAGKIIGGTFGKIEPGAMQTVSLVYPTTIIFNRVGHCNITISSTNSKNEVVEVSSQLQFDTRYTALDSKENIHRNYPSYMECANFDLDFVRNCTPINCEEKYMGKRNFYNTTSQMCESTPRCHTKSEIYNIHENRCLDLRHLVDASEIEAIKLKHRQNITKTQSAANTKSNNHVVHRQVPTQSIPVQPPPQKNAMLSPGDKILLIMTTFGIYLTICFVIFLLINMSYWQVFRKRLSIAPAYPRKSS